MTFAAARAWGAFDGAFRFDILELRFDFFDQWSRYIATHQ